MLRPVLREVLPAVVSLGAWFAPISAARAQVSSAAPGQETATEAAADKSELLAPVLLADPGAVYPAQALRAGLSERVEVVLILELDEAGRVAKARVETRRGHGFDEAALEAAEQLRFEPAKRSGKPVASRIRFRYAFEPPPPPVAERSPAATPAEATRAPRSEATKTAQEPSIEVTVQGERLAPTASSYLREEVRRIPGAFGDPFRAVETLPGVAPVVSGLPFFYVRGAPPGNVGYLLDGIRVPYLYHVGAGPAVVHPALIERVDFYPGGYPARFGRFAGGIVSAELAPPKAELHGEANLRLFDAGALVESGFANGRGTALIGGRYSYTAALLSLAAPEVQLAYHDFQARISYDLTPRDRVSLFSFGAYDLLGADEGDSGLQILFGSEFYRADLRYERLLDDASIRTAVTVGYDRTQAELFAPDDPRNLVARSIAARSEYQGAFGAQARLRAGLDVTFDAYRTEGAKYVDPDSPYGSELDRQFPPRTDRATGAWIDLGYQLTPALSVMAGLRADLYGSGLASALGVEPRLAGRLVLTPGFRVISALGVAHQPPSFIVPLPGVAPALGERLQSSVQSSLGFELDLDRGTTTGATGFYNLSFDLTDAFDTTGGDTAEPDSTLRARGRAFGAELFLRRRLTQSVGGLLSYTFSRSLRALDNHEYVSAFDRPHVLNAAISFVVGRGWTTGGRFLFYSGIPRQPAWASGAEDVAVVRTTTVLRQPAFYRIDVRVEKRWRLGPAAWLAFVVEFLNATLNKETWPGGEELGPVSIPSLGVEAGF